MPGMDMSQMAASAAKDAGPMQLTPDNHMFHVLQGTKEEKVVLPARRQRIAALASEYSARLLTALKAANERGSARLTYEAMSGEQRRDLTSLFEEKIYPLLTPLGIEPGRQFSVLPELSLCMLEVHDRPIHRVALSGTSSSMR